MEEKLQSQMDDTTKLIADLTNFSKGESSSSAAFSSIAAMPVSPSKCRFVRSRTKKDLQAKIDALLDEACKKGVKPRQLR
jgi:hypothetical protein